MDKSMMPIMMVMMIIMIMGIMFTVQGVMMHNQVDVEEAKFHELQAQYWSISKAERDAAPTGSALNQQLVELKQFPSELMSLKLIGVGKILTGIFVVLFGILIALMIMPKRLGKMMMKS